MPSKIIRTIYSQKTKEPKIKVIKHGKLVLGRDLLKRLFVEGYHAPKPLRKWERIIYRKKGITQLWTTYNPETKTLKFSRLFFDSNQRNSESLRRTIEMIKKAEEDAVKMGAKKIETDVTIISPKLASKFGYKLIWKGDKLYTYKKIL